MRDLPYGLKSLDVSFVDRWGQVPRLTFVVDFGHLPQFLKTLRLRGIESPSLRELPRGLENLSLDEVTLTNLEVLPESLKSLEISERGVRASRLPQGLESLTLSDFYIDSLETLPVALKSLAIQNSEIGLLGDLPSIEVLRLLNCKIEHVSLPASLKKLIVSRTHVSEHWQIPTGLMISSPPPRIDGWRLRHRPRHLRKLPQTLRSLELDGDDSFPVTVPADLPAGLKNLKMVFCYDSSGLRGLPSGVKSLILERCNIDDFNHLPDGLRYLALRETQVRSLNEGSLEKLPRSLRRIDLQGTKIRELRGLPPELEFLNLANTPIKDLKGCRKVSASSQFLLNRSAAWKICRRTSRSCGSYQVTRPSESSWVGPW